MSPELPPLSDNFKQFCDTYTFFSVFQPIILPRQLGLFGFEGLIRAKDEQENIIGPQKIFAAAQNSTDLLELDRICRRSAVESFMTLHRMNQEFVLFINISTQIISQQVLGSKMVYNLVKDFGLPPERVVLEILESQIESITALDSFVTSYKKAGFMIALDDMGAGHSNWNRIVDFRPNIIKLDRSLIDGIYDNFYKREVVTSIISMAHRIGALVVGEGIENEKDAFSFLEHQGDLVQGFFLHKPVKVDDFNLNRLLGDLGHFIHNLGNYMRDKVHAVNNMHKEYKSLLKEIKQKLENTGENDLEKKLKELILQYNEIECLYILNMRGLQITETIVSERLKQGQAKKIYQPALKGADQSIKDYYLFLQEGSKQFVSDPYISMATGHFCRTLSKVFQAGDLRYIVCLDVIDVPKEHD